VKSQQIIKDALHGQARSSCKCFLCEFINFFKFTKLRAE